MRRWSEFTEAQQRRTVKPLLAQASEAGRRAINYWEGTGPAIERVWDATVVDELLTVDRGQPCMGAMVRRLKPEADRRRLARTNLKRHDAALAALACLDWAVPTLAELDDVRWWLETSK